MPISVLDELARIPFRHNLTHAATADIADLLRRLGHDVPKDARTIKQTQRQPLVSAEFIHFGLLRGIVKRLSNGLVNNDSDKFQLQVSVDGIPLWRSSKVGFRPISCRITNANDKRYFIVSCWCGRGKPPVLENFIRPVLRELLHLESNFVDNSEPHIIELILILHAM